METYTGIKSILSEFWKLAKNYITENTKKALSGITSFDFLIVEQFPETGEKGTIYLVSQDSTEADNKYLEYLWINNRFELIGTKTIDLSNYVKTDDSRLSNARTPTAHNQASNTINAMTGYSKPSSSGAISATDTLNSAIGKLEKALDGKGTSSFSGNYNDLKNKPTSLPANGGTATTANKIRTSAPSSPSAGDIWIE